MSRVLRSYRETLAKLFMARRSHDEQQEDELLSMLDKLWLRMSAEDRAESESLGRKIATGELSEDAFCFAELRSIELGWDMAEVRVEVVQTSTVVERRSFVIRSDQSYLAKSSFSRALEMIA